MPLSPLHLPASLQELFAHGVSNLISSLFSCFPNSATLATTSLLVDAGGNTQVRARPWVRRRGEGHPGWVVVEDWQIPSWQLYREGWNSVREGE